MGSGLILRHSDSKFEYQILKKDILAAVKDVLDSGRYVYGQDVAALEKEFVAFCGVRYGVTTASATIALVVGLKALGIGPGDEVITSP